jgi:hypothetical protein
VRFAYGYDERMELIVGLFLVLDRLLCKGRSRERDKSLVAAGIA